MTTTPYDTEHYEPASYTTPGEDFQSPDAAIDSDVNGDQEADESENDVDTDTDDGAEEATDGAAGVKGRANAKPSRSVYRRVAAKTLEVQEASETVRALAAAVLGSSADVIELTTSIMAAPRLTSSPLVDIEAISEACREDPFEAAITAGALGRPRQKAVWSLLHTIGSVGSPAAPTADAKAALAVVKAVNKLTDDQQLDLAASGELLKRS